MAEANLSNNVIEEVWQKAYIDANNNPDIFRKDYAGAWIRRDQYGQKGKYGWEANRMVPLSRDGSQSIDNLFPLHWENDERKGQKYPEWQTCKSSSGNKNVDEIKNWIHRV